MIRAQVQLTESQFRRLKSEAVREGISFSEMVRRCIERTLDGQPADRSMQYRIAGEIVGAFPDQEGADDLSVNHDAYLDAGERS